MRRRTSRYPSHNVFGFAYLKFLSSSQVTLASPVSSRPACVTDSYSSICTTAIWTHRDGAAFISLGCGPSATTAHVLEKPLHGVFIGQEMLFTSGAAAQAEPSDSGLVTFTTSISAETGYEAAQATETGVSASGAESLDPIESPATTRILETSRTDYTTPPQPPPLHPSPSHPPATPGLTASLTESDPISTHPSPSSPKSSSSATEVPVTATTSAAAETPHGGGLAPGPVAGIIVGSIAGVALLSLGALYITWRHVVSRFGMAMGSIYLTLSRPRPAPASTTQPRLRGRDISAVKQNRETGSDVRNIGSG
ncbi:hypothetical protein PspLS_04376 [Pyricularia sp. CBS 133598]|nr:hypothetical protein PspLS_04376 [Pyricularia sp. CBS 133598]